MTKSIKQQLNDHGWYQDYRGWINADVLDDAGHCIVYDTPAQIISGFDLPILEDL